MAQKTNGIGFYVDLDLDQLKRQAEEANKILNGIGKDANEASKNTDALTSRIGKNVSEIATGSQAAAKNIKNVQKQAEDSASALNKLGKTIGGLFAIGTIKNFGESIFQVRSEMQALETSFEVLVGNKDKATALFSEIKEFAVSTPMDMPQLAKGAQTLLSFGIAQEKVMPLLRQIGDISKGNAENFNGLVLAYAQMSSAGKLMGQDLMQMIGRGFNPLNEIARTTGKSLAQVKEEMAAGKLTVEDVQKAFETATSAGGQFNGMLAKQSKTLGGALSNLRGAITDMQNELGEGLQGTFATAIDLATTLVKNYEKIANVLEVVAAAYGSYKAAVMGAIVVDKVERIFKLWKQYGQLTRILTAATKAQAAFNTVASLNPVGMIAAGLAAAGVALYKFKNYLEEITNGENMYNNAMGKTNDAIEKRKALVTQLIGKSKEGEGIGAEQVLAFNELRKIAPEITEQFKTIQELRKASDEELSFIENELYSEQKLKANQEIVEKTKESIESLKRQAQSIEKQGLGAPGMTEAFNSLQKRIAETQKEYDKASEYIKNYNDAIKEQMTVSEELNTKNNESEYLAEVKKQLDDNNKSLSERAKILKELEQFEKSMGGDYTRSDELQKSVDALNKELKKEAEETRKRKQGALNSIKEFTKEEIKAERDAAFERQQVRVDLMEDGIEKELSQIELNKQRSVAAIRDAEEKKLQAYKKNAYQQFIASNPSSKIDYADWEARKGGSVKLPNSVQRIYAGMLEDAEATADNQRKQAIKRALADYKTYYDKLADIEEDFRRKRGKLGKYMTKGQLAELNKQEREAVKRLRDEYGMDELKDNIMMLSEQEKELVTLTEEELMNRIHTLEVDKVRAEVAGKMTAEQKKQYDLSIKQLKNALNVKSKSGTKPEEGSKKGDSLKTINNLAQTMGTVSQTIKEAGKAISDSATSSTEKVGAIVDATASATQAVGSFMDGLGSKYGGIASTIGGIIQLVWDLGNLINTSLSDMAHDYSKDFEAMYDATNKVSAAQTDMVKKMNELYNENSSKWISDSLTERMNKLSKSYSRSAINMMRAEQAANNAVFAAAATAYQKEIDHIEDVIKKAESPITKFFSSHFSVLQAQSYKQKLKDTKDKAGWDIAQIEQQLKSKTGILDVINGNGKTVKQYLNAIGYNDKDLYKEDPFGNRTINWDVVVSASKTDEFKAFFGQWVTDTFEKVGDASEELNEQLQAIIENVKDLIGEVGTGLGNALVDAFAKGEVAADAFSNTLKTDMQNAIKSMISDTVYNNTIKKTIEAMYEELGQIQSGVDKEGNANTPLDEYMKQMQANALMADKYKDSKMMQILTFGKTSDAVTAETKEWYNKSGLTLLNVTWEQFLKGSADDFEDWANQLKTIMSSQVLQKYSVDLQEAEKIAEQEMKQMMEAAGLSSGFENEAQTASAKKSEALASVTQDSVDEMNGRLTAIQAHTFNISENTNMLVDYTNSILANVMQINTNTQRLASIEQSLKDINSYGIKVKA